MPIVKIAGKYLEYSGVVDKFVTPALTWDEFGQEYVRMEQERAKAEAERYLERIAPRLEQVGTSSMVSPNVESTVCCNCEGKDGANLTFEEIETRVREGYYDSAQDKVQQLLVERCKALPQVLWVSRITDYTNGRRNYVVAVPDALDRFTAGVHSVVEACYAAFPEAEFDVHMVYPQNRPVETLLVGDVLYRAGEGQKS